MSGGCARHGQNMKWRWLLVGLRIAAMLLTFAAILLPQLLLAAIGHKSFIPPRFLGVIGRIAGLRIQKIGRPASGKLLLLGNHISWLDIPAMAGITKTCFVAQGGLAKFRFLKWLCEQNDTVFIQRDKRGTVSAQVEQVRIALSIHARLTIFPEGTTSDGTGLLPFKSSLLSAVERVEDLDHSVTIQPFALVYEGAPDVSWIDPEPGMSNVCRILSSTKPLRLTIHFLEPLSGDQLASRKSMARAASNAIGDVLGLPAKATAL